MTGGGRGCRDNAPRSLDTAPLLGTSWPPPAPAAPPGPCCRTAKQTEVSRAVPGPGPEALDTEVPVFFQGDRGGADCVPRAKPLWGGCRGTHGSSPAPTQASCGGHSGVQNSGHRPASSRGHGGLAWGDQTAHRSGHAFPGNHHLCELAVQWGLPGAPQNTRSGENTPTGSTRQAQPTEKHTQAWVTVRGTAWPEALTGVQPRRGTMVSLELRGQTQVAWGPEPPSCSGQLPASHTVTCGPRDPHVLGLVPHTVTCP